MATNKFGGEFSIGQLPDGRFVAAAASEPYFCFRADSEEAVLEKVKKHLSFYRSLKTERSVSVTAGIRSSSVQMTTLRPQRRERVSNVLEAA